MERHKEKANYYVCHCFYIFMLGVVGRWLFSVAFIVVVDPLFLFNSHILYMNKYKCKRYTDEEWERKRER